MPKLLVTFGTDGNRDWVQYPDGTRKLIGQIPMARVIALLAGSYPEAAHVLDRFLEGESSMMAVDLEALESLFTPARFRLGSKSLVSGFGSEIPMLDPKIVAMTQAVLSAQKSLAQLSQKAAGLDSVKASPSQRQASLALDMARVQRLVSAVALEAKSRWATEAEGPAAPSSTDPVLEFKLAKVLTRLASVNGRLDDLKADRAPVNYLMAKLDVSRLVSRISKMAGAPLDPGSVRELEAASEHLYGLFLPSLEDQ